MKILFTKATDWVEHIPELSNVKGLDTWTNICDHLKLNHKDKSARRALKSWVKENKPFWTPVPNL